MRLTEAILVGLDLVRFEDFLKALALDAADLGGQGEVACGVGQEPVHLAGGKGLENPLLLLKWTRMERITVDMTILSNILQLG